MPHLQRLYEKIRDRRNIQTIGCGGDGDEWIKRALETIDKLKAGT